MQPKSICPKVQRLLIPFHIRNQLMYRKNNTEYTTNLPVSVEGLLLLLLNIFFGHTKAIYNIFASQKMHFYDMKEFACRFEDLSDETNGASGV